MPAPISFLRLTLSCALTLTALSLSAGSTDKEPAPRFNAKTTDGEKFANDSIKGKVVLLGFWTTWCGYCVQEAAIVDKLNHEFSGKGLLVLAINVGESKKTVKKYLDEHPRTSKIVMMEDTNLAAMYQANVYPVYVVIDRDGFVAAHQLGSRPAQTPGSWRHWQTRRLRRRISPCARLLSSPILLANPL